MTALLHHVTVDVLRAAFLALKRRAPPGIDDMTWDALTRVVFRQVNGVDIRN